MRLNLKKKALWALFVASGLVLHTLVTPGASAQDEDGATNPRVFWNSLTPAERKLPRDILIEQRLAAGKTVPPGWERSAQARSKNQGAEQVYRLDGDSLEALETVMSQIGAVPISRSLSRGYVTAILNDQQLIEASNYAVVRRIRYVKGPSAQGVTQAWQAHRISGMDGAGEPNNISTKPALSGDGVVIGIISRTVKQSDLDALVNVTNIANDVGSCLIPPIYKAADTCADNDGLLYLLSGVSDSQGTLPNVVSTSGSDDALNILQVIYDIAPDAQFVLASPGNTSTPADMARVIAKLAAGNNLSNTTATDFIPKANLIVDDLRYDTQSPFEVDEITEAVVAAKQAGVGYITAAGDGGHHESTGTTSNVHIDDFDGQVPPSSGGIYDNIWGNLHRFAGSTAYLKITQPLSDVCLFWSEDPDGATTTDDLTLWIFQDLNDNGAIDNGEPAADWYPISRPGECLSELTAWGGGTLPAGTKLILEDFAQTFTDRFLIEGIRATTSIVNPSTGADAITGAFSLTTSGSIRGHAYYPDVLTVGASPYFQDSGSVQAFKDGVAASKSLAVNDYSADGEAATQKRFYWENKGTSTPDWQAIADGGLAASKPDLLATSAISIKEVADCDSNSSTADAVCTGRTYHGTSAAAAAATGVAALYWEFRKWQVDANTNDTLTTVLPADVLNAVKASVLDGGASGWDAQFGFGVLDAPRGLESALPAANPVLTGSSPGVIKLDFSKAFNDLSELFTYSVSCAPESSNISPALIKANDVVAGTPGTDKAPMYYAVAPGTSVTCEIVSAHPQWSGSATVSVSAIATFTAPVEVSMTAKSAGVNLRFAPSSSASATTVTYTAACLLDGNAISGWAASDNRTVLPNTDYVFQADPGKQVTCDVTASAARTGATAITATSAGSATANLPADTVLSVTADSGGVGVSWVVDPNLPDSSMATISLTCTQGAITLLGPQQMTGSGIFIEADTSAPVQCSVTTQLTIQGGTTLTSSAVSSSATPDPEQFSGLPVWLLYVASQPQTVTATDVSVGTVISDLDTSIQIHSTQSVGQTFTAGVSGQLKSITLYLKEGAATTAGLAVEIKATSGGLPTGNALATQAVPDADVPGNLQAVSAVTVTFSTPATLSANTVYAILVSSTASGGEHYQLAYDASNNYASGTGLTATNGGTWSATSYDISFQTVMTYTQ